MKSAATVKILCGHEGCDNGFHTPLYSDGWYTQFHVPDDWYVKLDTDSTGFGNIARCPRHCKWIREQPSINDEGRYITGHWEIEV